MKDVTSAQLINAEKRSDGLVEGGALSPALSYVSVYTEPHK